MIIEVVNKNNNENIKYFDFDTKLENFPISKDRIFLFISFEKLGLGTKLYGKNKRESSLIQRKNAKLIRKIYEKFRKIILRLKKLGIDFENKIYVDRLSEKKNNNDFLLMALLDLYFDRQKNKLEKIISYSCDFLSKENTLNNMCDFKDNKCASCRERKIERVIGCCQKNCKYAHTGVCEVKNISCKLYMCDYLENRGYYFSSYYLPILREYLSPIERFVCKCMLFREMEFQKKVLKICRICEWTLVMPILIVVCYSVINTFILSWIL